MQFTYVATFIVIVVAFATSYFAKERGRNPLIWFCMGLLFSMMGLLALFLLPKVEGEKQIQTASEAKVIQDEFHHEAAIPSDNSEFPIHKEKKIPRNRKLKWFCANLDAGIEANGEVQKNYVGPMTFDELRKYMHDSNIVDTAYIWCKELEDWTTLSEFSDASILRDPDYLED